MSDGYFIGLISGTSRDGVDAALVLVEDERPRLLHALCLPYGEPLKSDLDRLLAAGEAPEDATGGTLDEFLGRHFARAAREVARQAGVEMRDVVAIGSHGQTVWHEPGGNPPRSIQLGNPRVLQRATGATVISDFRRADLDAGGQGAPLAPLLHRHLFFSRDEHRAVLNLGGIANLTFLPRNGSTSGHDTGPANCLLDAWIGRHLGAAFDEGGRWAAGGRADPGLLERLLDDPYFDRSPPKSTGLEYFNLRWLEARLPGSAPAPADVQSTLAELTARTVARDIRSAEWPVDRLLVCGGGAYNTDLLHRIAAQLTDMHLETTRHYGVHPEWVEAVLFAWLARERLAGRRQDTRRITGAREPVLLGRIDAPADGHQ